MRWRSLVAGLAAALLVTTGPQTHASTADPFAFFLSAVRLDGNERQRLDRREVVVRILPARDGELAVFAASRLDGPPEALVAWTHAIAALKKGPFVQAIHRFSDPPVLGDVDELSLDEIDLDAVRRCRGDRCDVKLRSHEIQRLQAAAAAAPSHWQAAVQRAFRDVVIDRVASYNERADDIAAVLAPYPAIDGADRESFFYWSKERYGTGKPVVTVTHVTIVRPQAPAAPAVLVLGREIFATHYRTASLGITAVVQDRVKNVNYLTYLNRSHVDVLGGVFGGLKRMLIEGRIRSESAALVGEVRARLETGAPSP